MSKRERLILFGLVVIVGGVLAALRVIGGDSWIYMTLCLLAPSPLEGGGAGPGMLSRLKRDKVPAGVFIFFACALALQAMEAPTLDHRSKGMSSASTRQIS